VWGITRDTNNYEVFSKAEEFHVYSASTLSDYYSDIYIRETDYPIFQKDFSEEWISVWMNSFGEKYYFEQGRIIQRKKEQMKRRWW
jgi:hypothetical protein